MKKRKRKDIKMRLLPPDDPDYSTGCIIGGRRIGPTTPTSRDDLGLRRAVKQMEKEMREGIKRQAEFGVPELSETHPVPARNEQIEKIAVQLARNWFKMQCRDIHQSLYLWIRPATGANGPISPPLVSAEQPDERYSLATPERLSQARSERQQAFLIAEMLSKAEILNPKPCG